MDNITVSDSAMTKIKEYFLTHEKKPIRVVVMAGCGGTALGMSVDEATDKDIKIIKEDLEFIASQELINLVGNIEIEYLETFFNIKSEKELPGREGGGGCTSCPSCS